MDYRAANKQAGQVPTLTLNIERVAGTCAGAQAFCTFNLYMQGLWQCLLTKDALGLFLMVTERVLYTPTRVVYFGVSVESGHVAQASFRSCAHVLPPGIFAVEQGQRLSRLTQRCVPYVIVWSMIATTCRLRRLHSGCFTDRSV